MSGFPPEWVSGITGIRIIVFYLSLLVFPHPSRLNLSHDFGLSLSLFDPPGTFISIILIIGLLIYAVLSAKRNRLLSFCILWFLGNLAIESSVVGLEIIFEHRVYLPSMLLILLAVTSFWYSDRLKILRVTALVLIAVVLSIWTYERNAVWRDRVTLWSDCVNKSPDSARAHNNLGAALKDKGKTEEAIRHLQKAISLKSEFYEAKCNLASALATKGDLDAAIHIYTDVLRIKIDPTTLYNLGNALRRKGELDAAIRSYRRALRVNPNYIDANYNLGITLEMQGNKKDAAYHYQEEIRINPYNLKARRKLDKILNP